MFSFITHEKSISTKCITPQPSTVLCNNCVLPYSAHRFMRSKSKSKAYIYTRHRCLLLDHAPSLSGIVSYKFNAFPHHRTSVFCNYFAAFVVVCKPRLDRFISLTSLGWKYIYSYVENCFLVGNG